MSAPGLPLAQITQARSVPVVIESVVVVTVPPGHNAFASNSMTDHPRSAVELPVKSRRRRRFVPLVNSAENHATPA